MRKRKKERARVGARERAWELEIERGREGARKRERKRKIENFEVKYADREGYYWDH